MVRIHSFNTFNILICPDNIFCISAFPYMHRYILRRHGARIVHQHLLFGYIVRVEVFDLEVVHLHRLRKLYALSSFHCCYRPVCCPDFVALFKA